MSQDPSLSSAAVTAATGTSQRILSGVELKTMAANGGFAVDETTGNRMIQALQGVIDSLESRWSTLQRFQQTPPMSTTSTAQWVAGQMVSTATDEKGLLTQLQQARAEFPTYIEAINLAKSNYKEREQSTSTTLSSFNAGA
ncbi:MAG TPA: hypothetical protein VFG87_27620 [Amycolatopsis sp.]|jgi:hypothetical protein|nr:hypothetical protein [Amycolatopsis sp.]